MKKILYLFMFTLIFAACSSSDDPDPVKPDPKPGEPTNPIPESEWKGDWNDKLDPTNYKPEYGGQYNPLFGKWILTSQNGKAVTDFLVYDFASSGVWNVADKKPADGKAPEYKRLDNKIKINDTAIKNSKGVIFKYQVSTDRKSMTLFDGSTTMTFAEYDNNGVWYWRGDWNNPKDAGYRPEYNGKYNPIVGTWKLVSVGGHNVEPIYYQFNDDFTITERHDPIATKRSYKINDTGVWEDSWGIHKSEYSSYKIEGNTLIYDAQPYSEYYTMIFTRQ
jgi:hypothetical protein